MLITTTFLLLNKGGDEISISLAPVCFYLFISFVYLLTLGTHIYDANHSYDVIDIVPKMQLWSNRNKSLETHQGIENVQSVAFRQM